MNASGQTDLSTSETSCVHMLKVGGDLGASQKSCGGRSPSMVVGAEWLADELFLFFSELLGCWSSFLQVVTSN